MQYVEILVHLFQKKMETATQPILSAVPRNDNYWQQQWHYKREGFFFKLMTAKNEDLIKLLCNVQHMQKYAGRCVISTPSIPTVIYNKSGAHFFKKNNFCVHQESISMQALKSLPVTMEARSCWDAGIIFLHRNKPAFSFLLLELIVKYYKVRPSTYCHTCNTGAWILCRELNEQLGIKGSQESWTSHVICVHMFGLGRTGLLVKDLAAASGRYYHSVGQ